MLKTLISFLLIVICLIPLPAQTENELLQANLEEHGASIPAYNNEVSELFSDDPSTWNPLAVCPSIFGRAVMGSIGNYIYLFSGQNTASLAVAYHIPTNTWTASTPCTAPGYNPGFCVANGELYKLSGSGSTSVFEKFTPAGDGTGTWTVLTSTSGAIMNAVNSIVWDGGNYIYAQASTTTAPYTSVLERYNITAGTWEPRTGATHARRYAGLACIGGDIYMVGGLVYDGTSPRIVQKYNIASDSWADVAELPEDVNFTKWSVTTDGQYVFLVGSGGGYSSWPLSPNCYYYTPSTNTWALESTLPAPRGLAFGLFMNGFYKLFFGGGNDGTGGAIYQDDVWEGVGGVYSIPVELTSFNAFLSVNGVVLNWTTATETNNSHFVLERSLNKNSFIEVCTVPGHGTTTQQNNYSYLDKDISFDKLYYRLKQVDFDGSLEYSNIIEADASMPLKFGLKQNYPNPFNPSTRIEFTIDQRNQVSLKVFDILGNEVAVLLDDIKEPGIYTHEFDGSSLSSGVYVYRLQSGSNVTSRSMILTK